MDRIDYNIEKALENHKEANVELKQAEENVKSNRSRNAILGLIVLIAILSILLIYKIFG